MADLNAQLSALKGAASTYKAKLQLASTRDEALIIAVDAAGDLMKAIDLSSDSDEVELLKAQCSAILDVASDIKTSQNWKTALPPPPSYLVQAKGKTATIDHWAADVANSTDPALIPDFIDLNDETTPPSSSRDVVVSPGPSKERGYGSDGGLLKTSEGEMSSETTGHRHLSGPGSDAQYGINFASPNVSYGHITLSAGKTNLVAHQAPQMAPVASRTVTTVRRLIEPLSSRKLSKREQIILLRASIVNGFKFPPWDKPPTSEEFALVDGNVFMDYRDLALSPYQMQFFADWVRAEHAVPPPSLYSPTERHGLGPVMGASHTIDLVQDAATDCSVVASLCAAIARAERGHDQMLSNMISPYDKNLGKPVISPNGKYIVRLNFNGCWRKVQIDDRLPLSKSHRLLHVMDRKNPALLWPALLEKAYLKVRGGYDFPGSNSCSDLWTLTGWIPEQIYLQETDTIPNQLWKRTYNAFLYGDVLVTVGTGKMSSKQERELGLEGQHSYVVLDMKETEHNQLLLVKNPWVEGKGWRGPRPHAAPAVDALPSSVSNSRGCDEYNKDSIPSKNRPHPTTFWISLDHVIQHFESLYLNWNPGLFRNRQDIHFEWQIDNEENASGCIVNHPQFSLTTQGNDAVWLLLSRHFRDVPEVPRDESDAFLDGTARTDSQVGSSGESLKGYMSILVCNGQGNVLYIKDTYLESGPYVNTTQSLLRWDSEPNSTYTIVVDQEELPASIYTFSLSAFSNTNIDLGPAKKTYGHQTAMTGDWSRRTAGGSTSSPRYFENPQYHLEVHSRSDVAILLTSKHAHPMHIKLAIGFGKRIYRLAGRDVLADSGEHRAGSVLATAQDVPPGHYTIVCSLFEADMTGDFALRVDSTTKVTLTQIPRDGAGLISRQLSPACFGSQTHKVAASLFVRRLASFTIVARFVKATSPRSHEVNMLARSPFRLSVEVGRGPDRRFLLTSERGEFADSAIVRSEATTIAPEMTGQGDVWLILERLSSTGGPIEEWYDVEIFTDAAQAFEIGVWRAWDD